MITPNYVESSKRISIAPTHPRQGDSGSEDEMKWYCVQVGPKREHIAAANLQVEEGVEVFCPRIRYRKKTRRGVIWFVEAMFPMYLFARFDYPRHHRFVRHAHGVSTIVHFGREIGVVPDEVVETLKERCAAENGIPIIQIDPPINEGDVVKVEEGPFRGVEALVTRVLSAKERVRILIEVMGRQVELELETGAVVTKESPRVYL